MIDERSVKPAAITYITTFCRATPKISKSHMKMAFGRNTIIQKFISLNHYIWDTINQKKYLQKKES